MAIETNDHPRRRLARSAAIVALTLLAAAPAIAAGAGPVVRPAEPSALPGAGSAGASGEAALLAGATGAASMMPRAASSGVDGIDVSHWQGSIDWSRVADKGKAFAYLKSTDDVDYVDPTFAFNRAQAKANGLTVGAYHFARPDPSAGDAVAEARWFVQRTDPRPGELLPVLDIETNDGLTQTQMATWAHRWVEEVRERTGVTAMVYTSPYGWLERFGDSRRLARDGSPLWVAHWGVSSPLVPAGNWDGNGWALWQYSSQGTVAGIQGDVDLDRLGPGTLGRLTIRRLSLEVTGGAGRITSAPAGLGCSGTCQRNVDPDTTVTLSAVPDENAYFTGWGGACGGTAATCIVTMQGNRSVTATFVTDITAPVAKLTKPAGFTDAAIVRFDEPVRGVNASNVFLRRVGGGGVAVRRTCRSSAGGIVACSPGTVRSVSLRPRRPLVPGRRYQVVVNPAGGEPVTDRVGNPAATTQLSFQGKTAVDQGQVPVSHAWRIVRTPAALGGSFIVERLPGAALSFDFKGRSVTWHTVMGPAYGRAQVLIDGRPVRVVDLWDRKARPNAQRHFDGLGAGAHTITIRPAGRSRGAATDRRVAVDGFGTAAKGTLRTPSTRQRWRTVEAAHALGGSYAVADLGGAALTLAFDGVGVDLTTVTGPDRGRLRVLVDGSVVTTLDQYSAARTFGVSQRIDGLADGPHTLRLEATGTSRAGAKGTVVAIDRFGVLSP